MALCSCFGPSKAERREAAQIESQQARSMAAQAAQKRQEQFEKSAVGKAAKAQMAAAAKQSHASNKGEPVLKATRVGAIFMAYAFLPVQGEVS